MKRTCELFQDWSWGATANVSQWFDSSSKYMGLLWKDQKMLILSLLIKHDNASNIEKQESVCPAEVRHKLLLYLDWHDWKVHFEWNVTNYRWFCVWLYTSWILFRSLIFSRQIYIRIFPQLFSWADFYAVQKGVGQSDTPATWLNLMRVQRINPQIEGRWTVIKMITVGKAQ